MLQQAANHGCEKLAAQPALTAKWILNGQQVIFGMRHQTDHIAPFIAETGNVRYGTVGIEWITGAGRPASGIHIAKGHQLVCL